MSHVSEVSIKQEPSAGSPPRIPQKDINTAPILFAQQLDHAPESVRNNVWKCLYQLVASNPPDRRSFSSPHSFSTLCSMIPSPPSGSEYPNSTFVSLVGAIRDQVVQSDIASLLKEIAEGRSDHPSKAIVVRSSSPPQSSNASTPIVSPSTEPTIIPALSISLPNKQTAKKEVPLWGTDFISVLQQLVLVQHWAPLLDRLPVPSKKMIIDTVSTMSNSIIWHSTGSGDNQSFQKAVKMWIEDPAKNRQDITLLFGCVGFLASHHLIEGSYGFPGCRPDAMMYTSGKPFASLHPSPNDIYINLNHPQKVMPLTKPGHGVYPYYAPIPPSGYPPVYPSVYMPGYPYPPPPSYPSHFPPWYQDHPTHGQGPHMNSAFPPQSVSTSTSTSSSSPNSPPSAPSSPPRNSKSLRQSSSSPVGWFGPQGAQYAYAAPPPPYATSNILSVPPSHKGKKSWPIQSVPHDCADCGPQGHANHHAHAHTPAHFPSSSQKPFLTICTAPGCNNPACNHPPRPPPERMAAASALEALSLSSLRHPRTVQPTDARAALGLYPASSQHRSIATSTAEHLVMSPTDLLKRKGSPDAADFKRPCRMNISNFLS
eukprot:TRINITY_DN4545_c0_g1_i1.p1 TRINITY_DN4545_c0_g1~~TRINITY_DN4545_c0_g1_i1.p1  ORF type:complete len:596 (-),score=105.13 TRINITY_DN4545_c0_g1_i1:194-1981(-)